MIHRHYKTIGEYFSDLGLPSPEHPLFAVVSVSTNTGEQLECPDMDFISTTDFYAISNKRVIEGDILYGKKSYDCNSGTMLFLAPKQEFRTKGVKIKAEGRLILMHQDFLKGNALASRMKDFGFFNYAVNEALHLAPREEALVNNLFDSIQAEYRAGYDEHSREIILSYIKTLLNYGERFYKRQFIQRNDVSTPVHKALFECLDRHYAQSDQIQLPVLAHLAESMGLSQRYLSDAVKVETGVSAKEQIQVYIMEKAKEMLTHSSDSVSSVAYGLGYEYPQYFVRLFKKKNGMTPTEYRESFH